MKPTLSHTFAGLLSLAVTVLLPTTVHAAMSLDQINRLIVAQCPEIVSEMTGRGTMTPIVARRPIDVPAVCKCTGNSILKDKRLQDVLKKDARVLAAIVESEMFTAYFVTRLLLSVQACVAPELEAALQAADPAGTPSAIPPVNATEAALPRLRDELPYGRWTGPLTTRTVPDVDKDGVWEDEVVLTNCPGSLRIQYKKEDGTLTEGFAVRSTAHRRVYLLSYHAAEHSDETGWIESQVWTLVDARPKVWTLSQSRAVFNQDMKPDDPWLTFRRFAWGTVEFDPDWCSRK